MTFSYIQEALIQNYYRQILKYSRSTKKTDVFSAQMLRINPPEKSGLENLVEKRIHHKMRFNTHFLTFNTNMEKQVM